MEKKNQELLENLKDQIIAQEFHNEEVSLAEKINICQDLEKFAETWRSLIFAEELKEREKKQQQELAMVRIREWMI